MHSNFIKNIKELFKYSNSSKSVKEELVLSQKLENNSLNVENFDNYFNKSEAKREINNNRVSIPRRSISVTSESKFIPDPVKINN